MLYGTCCIVDGVMDEFELTELFCGKSMVLLAVDVPSGTGRLTVCDVVVDPLCTALRIA